MAQTTVSSALKVKINSTKLLPTIIHQLTVSCLQLRSYFSSFDTILNSIFQYILNELVLPSNTRTNDMHTHFPI